MVRPCGILDTAIGSRLAYHFDKPAMQKEHSAAYGLTELLFSPSMGLEGMDEFHAQADIFSDHFICCHGITPGLKFSMAYLACPMDRVVTARRALMAVIFWLLAISRMAL